MTKEFVILCSAQRLAYQDANDGAVDYYAFGMNLTAAIGVSPAETASVTVTPDEARALRPWLWAGIRQVQAATIKDGSNIFPCAVIGLPASRPDLDYTTLLNELNAEYNPDRETQLNTVTVWPLPEGAAQVVKKVSLDFNVGARHKVWHSSILQLSTYPYPIPQFLNLSFIVKVPKSKIADPKAPLYLAPIIPDTNFFTAATKPQGALTDTGDRRGVLRWHYDKTTKTGLNVAAYLLPSQVEDDPVLQRAGFFDMKTGWIKAADTFEEDWRAYFERRAGEVFDLSERLIDYLRDHIAEVQAEPASKPSEPALIPFLQKVTVDLMRDLAGTGLLPAINGRTLPEDLIGSETDRNKKLPPNGLDQLRAVEKELFGDGPNPGDPTGDVKWRKFLADNLPQVSGLKALKTIEVDKKLTTEDVPQPAEDCLSELEQLHKALLDPDNLHTIVQRQWEEIFKKLAPALPPWAQFLRDKIAALKSDFDYRSRLASCNLGPVWNALRRQANDPASKGANLDMKALIQALLINHLEARLKLPQTKTPNVSVSDYVNYLPELNASPQPTLKCGAGAAHLALVDCIIADLEKPDPATGTSKLARLAENVSPPANSLEKATDVPHSVSLQAHLTTMLPDQQTAFDDILSQISGVLVFLRDQTERVWTCLNYARVNIRKSTQDKINLVAVPSRINYQNALTQSLITYNNVPLVARSPLADIPNVKGNATIGPDRNLVNKTGTQDVEPLIIYDYSRDPQAKIKALVFRDKSKMYDAALCVVSANGALPREISSPEKPWELDAAKLRTLDFSAMPGYLRSFSYERKVRTGQVRSKNLLLPKDELSTKSKKNPLNLPKIPDKVYPAALELPPQPLDPVNLPDGPSRILADELPLLVLAPDEWRVPQDFPLQPDFTFFLRKPATDVETWHRWVNDGGNQNGRAGVLTEYYRTSDDNRLMSKELMPFDITFDDPAVKGFHAELLRFDPRAPSPALRWVRVGSPQQVDVPPKPAPATLKDVQSDPLTVVCHGGASEGLLPPAGGRLQVNCRKGEIYWLRISAFVRTSETSRFAKVVSKEFRDTSPATGIKLTSPFELLIEVATEDLPTENEVWQSLTPRFLSDDMKGDRVEVSLESDVGNFRHIHRAEMQRQTWYWQGRETREFPSLATLPNDFVNPDLLNPATGSPPFGLSDEVKLWEEFEFAARSEQDFTILDFKRASELDKSSMTPAAAIPKRWFTYAEQLTPERDNPQLSNKEKSDQLTLDASKTQTSEGSNEKGDLRSHYYRFSAEVFSRYEGVIPESKPRSKKAKNPQLDPKDDAAKWRRLFVPCRRKELPPVPKIKLILPLTESFVEHDATRSPGLLVLLNEPWYEWGGLGEGIIAEVETLADPHNPSDVQADPCPPGGGGGTKVYFELGPDPMLLGTDAGVTKSRLLLPQSDSLNPAAVSAVSLERIRGPVGHTHDETDEGALFTATSFIVPAPKILNQGSALEDLSWYMCKIRLLRLMRLKGSQNKDISAVLQSEATEPQWVQYLPEFSLFSCGRTVKDLYISVGQTSVTIKNNKDDTVMPPSELSGAIEKESPVFSPVLLLTRLAFNASGELNQEVYVGFCWPEADSTWTLLPEVQGASNDILKNLTNNKEVHFRGRILGVQGVPLPTAKPNNLRRPLSSKDFCDSLFAYNERDEKDEKGNPLSPPISDELRPRIVRISQQILDSRNPHEGKICGPATPPPTPPRRRR